MTDTEPSTDEHLSRLASGDRCAFDPVFEAPTLRTRLLNIRELRIPVAVPSAQYRSPAPPSRYRASPNISLPPRRDAVES